MPGEVDRVLFWMNRVELLEGDLEKTHRALHGLIRAKLESAKRTQQAAILGLISAAHRGDPEALVALDALEGEIEERTWSVPPRSAA